MPNQDIDAGTVRAERLDIVDAKGRSRIWIATDPVNCAPYFYLLDESQHERIGIALDDKCDATVRFFNTKDVGVIGCKLTDSVVSMSFSRPDGRSFLEFYADESGKTQITIYNAEGHEILRMAI